MSDCSPLPSVSLRAVILGLTLALVIAVGEPYGVLVVRGSALAADFSTGAALCLFFFVVLLINPVLSLLRRTRLRRGELVTVYIMMIVAAAIPSWGFTLNLIPLMAGFSYYATSSNDWGEQILPFLPDWLIVSSDAGAVQGLFEGVAVGVPLPWDAWMRPLLAWSAFIVTIYFVTICLLVILRRQWMEHEKLLFPLATLPLEMSASDRGATPLFRSWLMWIGFIIPTTIKSTIALHSYFPFVPAVDLKTNVILLESMRVPLTPHFEVIGLSYLLSLDVSLSIWLFALLSMVATAVMNVLGWSIGPVQAFSDPSPPSIAHLALGALFFLVVSSFWNGRSHVKDVLSKAFGSAPEVDDSQELLSYRTAVFGAIIGSLVAGVWLHAAGLSVRGTVVFLLSSLIIYIGVARIISQTGLAYARAAVASPVFTVNALGGSALGPSGLGTLGLSFAWAADLRTFVMASTATGLKMAREVGLEHRRLFWAIAAAIFVSLVGSACTILVLAYEYGGINIGTWQFQSLSSFTGSWILGNIADPQPTQWWHVGFTGMGAAGMAVLTYLKSHVVGFPIHPIGMAIGLTWPLYNVWFSICIAWILKAVILKYIGSGGYATLRPLFLGLILGGFVTTGFWLIIDGLTGMSGNVLSYF